MNGETTRTRFGLMSSCAATPCCAPRTFCVDSQMVSSVAVSQAQVVWNSSIGLWCCAGVS